jgi:dihydroorotase
VLGLREGTLGRGAAADVTVFDPERWWVVEPSHFVSKGRNTPYAGKELRGRAVYTIVGGEVVFRLDAMPRAHNAKGNA